MIQLNKNSGIHNALVEAPDRVVFFNDTACTEVVFDPRIKFFRADVPMVVWMKPYLRYVNQPRFRVPQAIRDFFLGIKYGYPICCVLNFCWGTFWDDRPQGTKRGKKYTENGEPYVPCFYHSSRGKAK